MQLFLIDHIALVKQGDNALGNIRLSICVSVRILAELLKGIGVIGDLILEF